MDSAVLTSFLLGAQMEMALDHKIIRAGEVAANDVHAKAASVLAASSLSRAETSCDRRFYKTLTTLYTTRFHQAQLELATRSFAQLSRKLVRESRQRDPE